MSKRMRLVARILLLAAALWAGPVALAEETQASEPVQPVRDDADWKLNVTLSADGSTIFLVGDLLDGAYFRVVKLLRESPKVNTLWLGSPGGRSKEGLLIGDLVKKYKLNTYVGHFCGSACTQIFVAGKERILGPDAQLGFHESYYVADDGGFVTEAKQTPAIDLPQNFARRSIFDPRLGTMSRLSYERAGLPAEFIEKAFAVPPEEMWRPAREELRQAGVFTKTVGGTDEIASPAGMRLRKDIEQEMAVQPFWGRMYITYPDVFAAAIDEIWMEVNSGRNPERAKLAARNILAEKSTPLVGYAPDAVLDRYALLLGEIAAAQRRLGYPDCARKADQPPENLTEQDMQFLQREDILLDEIIAASGKQEKTAMKDAQKAFFKLYGHSIKSGSVQATASDGEQKRCEAGQRLLEDNITQKPKDRIKAFRALMQMGETKARTEITSH